MVKFKEKFVYLSDGTIDIQEWLDRVKSAYRLKNTATLAKSCAYTGTLVKGMTTFYGRPCFEHGLEIAEILLSLNLDQDTACAGLVSGAVTLAQPDEQAVNKELGESIAKLVLGVRKADMVTVLQKEKSGNLVQIDKIRKMLLAMATDIRVVIIKLAERLCFMRGIKSIPLEERQRFANEIQEIYAPLANRLGIGQLKWELEDLAFRYLNPEMYKKISGFIAEKRTDREARINKIINDIHKKLNELHIKGEITGRAKHIYSIFSKMQRKDLDQGNIYDYSAIRILVPTIEDCYQTLSVVHHAWSPIMNEFDDYIANPKPNGYRSIHTAVIGEDEKHFEIQIRTFEMHDESERGIAAHWLYKENQPAPQHDKDKISYLRQLIAWHQEVMPENETKQISRKAIFEDQVYVITPAGDILDLPTGSTAIDFAYHIHSEVGHRCRGAKINGHIVPLTYQLKTGDKVEINTIAEGHPSRDWINPELGYIKTTRARSKITHWFHQQELQQDIAEGRTLLEKELSRSGLAKTTSLESIAKLYHFKHENDLLSSIGKGNIKPGQIIHAIQPRSQEKPSIQAHSPSLGKASTSPTQAIIGAADLLTRIAKCCKPIPGDPIIGYISQVRGIAIHKINCPNTRNFSNPNRFIDIDWDKNKTSSFLTDLKIVANESDKFIHNLTALLAHEKIILVGLTSNKSRAHHRVIIVISIQLQNMAQLQHLLHRIEQIPGVLEVMCIRS